MFCSDKPQLPVGYIHGGLPKLFLFYNLNYFIIDDCLLRANIPYFFGCFLYLIIEFNPSFNLTLKSRRCCMGCGHNSGRVHATDRRRRMRRYRHDASIMFISFHCSSSARLRDGAYLRPRPRRRVRREEDRPRRLKPNELPSEEERFPDLRD